MILNQLGSSGTIQALQLWDEGDPDSPGIAVGNDGITPRSLQTALRVLRPLAGRFAAHGIIVLHNCYAGGRGLPLMQALARELHVDVNGRTGPTLGFVLTGLNPGQDVTAHPDGTVYRMPWWEQTLEGLAAGFSD